MRISNTQKRDIFVRQAGDLLDQLSELVDKKLPQKGGVSNDCAYVAIKNSIGELDAILSGISSEDMEPDPDWQSVNEAAGLEG